jgi:hypothetical protein
MIRLFVGIPVKIDAWQDMVAVHSMTIDQFICFPDGMF